MGGGRATSSSDSQGSTAVISDPDTARKIAKLALEIGRRLDRSLAHVQATCSPEEFTAYQRAVRKVKGDLLLEVLKPLCAAHPDLKPSELP
jgi:hypothetical protein